MTQGMDDIPKPAKQVVVAACPAPTPSGPAAWFSRPPAKMKTLCVAIVKFSVAIRQVFPKLTKIEKQLPAVASIPPPRTSAKSDEYWPAASPSKTGYRSYIRAHLAVGGRHKPGTHSQNREPTH
jgi:hypothetical protein